MLFILIHASEDRGTVSAIMPKIAAKERNSFSRFSREARVGIRRVLVLILQKKKCGSGSVYFTAPFHEDFSVKARYAEYLSGRIHATTNKYQETINDRRKS